MSEKKKDTKFKPGNNVGKQFSKEYQPKNTGRKGKQITQHLKTIGNATNIVFDITITDAQGREIKKKGTIDAKDKSMNELLGTMMWVDAIKGNQKAQKEILDRIEGRSQTHLDITSQGEVLTLTPDERRSKLQKLKEKLLGKKSEE